VYDTLGRVVANLAEGSYPEGTHAVQFDASHLSSGIYLYRLQAGSHLQTRSMLLAR
jgi:hypothetical protein